MNKINVGNDLYLKGRIGWKGLSKDEYLERSNFRIINGTALEGKFINWSKCGFITEERYEESPEIKLEESDILISKDGTLGKIGYVKNLRTPSTVASGIFVLRNIIKDKLDTDYLYHFLKSNAFKEFINRMKASGSTILHLYQRDLAQLELELPKIEIQKKISEVLNSIDSKIELNNRINAELEALAKTLYDYWFVQFDFPDKNGKPYKTTGGKMIWNEGLKREIPEGWSVGTLLDIANYANGLPCQKFRPTGDEFLRVIKIREMNEGFTENSELVRPNIPEKAIIQNGDVLFSWSASLEVKIWTGGKGALNQHIFKVSSGDYPKSFYYYQLLNYLQHFKMIAENRKTTMGHITQEHLQQSRIAIPPKELTKELDKIIAPIFSKRMNNEIENQKLTELRDWLLPMLMNGQVKVN